MEIELIKFLNNSADCKNLLIIGVVHGDEEQGEYLIKRFLEENPCREIKNNVYYIPRLNKAKTRKNPNGVDLNRNFPTKNWELSDEKSDYFGGHAPNSEKETKFLIDLTGKIKFDYIITLHAPYKIINYDGDGELLAGKISKILSYPVQKDIGYPTPGSMGTYFGIEQKTPIITVEMDENLELERLYPKFKKLFEYLETEF